MHVEVTLTEKERAKANAMKAQIRAGVKPGTDEAAIKKLEADVDALFEHKAILKELAGPGKKFHKPKPKRKKGSKKR